MFSRLLVLLGAFVIASVLQNAPEAAAQSNGPWYPCHQYSGSAYDRCINEATRSLCRAAGSASRVPLTGRACREVAAGMDFRPPPLPRGPEVDASRYSPAPQYSEPYSSGLREGYARRPVRRSSAGAQPMRDCSPGSCEEFDRIRREDQRRVRVRTPTRDCGRLSCAEYDRRYGRGRYDGTREYVPPQRVRPRYTGNRFDGPPPSARDRYQRPAEYERRVRMRRDTRPRGYAPPPPPGYERRAPRAHPYRSSRADGPPRRGRSY